MCLTCAYTAHVRLQRACDNATRPPGENGTPKNFATRRVLFSLGDERPKERVGRVLAAHAGCMMTRWVFYTSGSWE